MTLLPNAVIEFGPNGKIIIENGTGGAVGGTLILQNNSKLTSITSFNPLCKVMWQGVEVWGDATKPSNYLLGQGRIIMQTGSTIENAHIGVLLGKPSGCIPGPLVKCPLWAVMSGGGIIDADGANFNNNGTAVQFIYYSNVNSSYIRNCTFTGGVLLDDGYKTTNSYIYPNSANPYYAPAINSSGTAPRLSYLLGVKNVTFKDNIFQTADIGIQIYDAKCIIVKSPSSLLGNQFINLNQGISGMYSSTSPFGGNTIKENTFNNTILPSVGSSPVAGIFLSGSQVDRIEGNTFGDPFFPLPITQAYNPYGIYLDNSSYFKILDNSFNKTQTGIYVNNSFTNGGIIQRYINPNGNFFRRCSTSVSTNLRNINLKIRCNVTNNNDPNDYGINWYNSGGKLANQGQPAAASQITNPAGNRFNVANFTSNCSALIATHRREIKNAYGIFYTPVWPPGPPVFIPLKYTYYSHNSPVEYIPCNSTNDVNRIITNAPCPGFTQCCPTNPCLSATPPYWCHNNPNRIGDIDQQISFLQTEFNTVFGNLDKGQTAQLLSAISSNTNSGQLKNMLLNDSPLSDAVLLAYINLNGIPPGHFKDVMLPNSPVSENVIPSLQIKLNTLPPGIAAQIQNAQSSSNRTLTTINSEISALQVEKQSIVNDILSFYVDNDSAQAINLLEQQNTVDADQSLLGTYITDGNLSAAQTKLSSMTAANAEEQAFLDLQGMILTLAGQGKSVFEMDSQQEQLVRNIAAMPSSLAQINACAILNLVFNENCSPSVLREQAPSSSVASATSVSSISYLGDNIPNPFTNLSVIPYSLPEGIEKAFINVYDITGKLINGYEVHNKNNTLIISSKDFSEGVYIYKLETNGEILGSKKMIIMKE